VSGDWDFLGQRVIMVGPWPPARDGIARFGAPLARSLAQSRDVRRVGFPEGHGERRLALHTGLRALKLLAEAHRGDDVLVQYHPHYYVRGAWASRVACYLSWALLVRLRRVSFVVHELDDPRPAELGRRGRAQFALEEAVRRLFWRRAARAVFLSDWQRGRFAQRYPRGSRGRTLQVAEHGAMFTPATSAGSREVARSRLRVDAHRVLLLMIGFLSPSNPDKGYARALRALELAGDERVDLHIVGSPIRQHTEVDRLVETLRQAAASSPQVHLHVTFCTDEEFDLWILAADAVLLPYREAASSGVAARARMLGTRIVTSGAGGLAEQLGPEDITAETDGELAAAIRRVADDAGGA
jgi:glycosyltransferase involved in cell wall biosynthesis